MTREMATDPGIGEEDEALFERAAAFLNSSSAASALTAPLSSDHKLQFYGWFKQACRASIPFK